MRKILIYITVFASILIMDACKDFLDIQPLDKTGTETYPRPSRFLSEIPATLLQEVRPRAHITRPAAVGARPLEPDIAGGLRLGQHVVHATFGEGVVTSYEGQGSGARVQVNFAGVGSKWLVLAYAKLQAV